jgi:hypothetical protein
MDTRTLVGNDVVADGMLIMYSVSPAKKKSTPYSVSTIHQMPQVPFSRWLRLEILKPLLYTDTSKATVEPPWNATATYTSNLHPRRQRRQVDLYPMPAPGHGALACIAFRHRNPSRDGPLAQQSTRSARTSLDPSHQVELSLQ